MLKSIKRAKTASIALVLVLTIASLMTFLPMVNAVTNVQIYAFLSVAPNPVGVGQTLTVSGFTQPIPPNAEERFGQVTCTVTHPDGTTETLGPVLSGPLGNTFWLYVPSVTGTYKFQYHVPTTSYPARNVVYLGDDSDVVSVTVQQAAVEPWSDTPLPTEYWTYPINAQNRLWGSGQGPWLMGSYNGTRYNPYTTIPKQPHILWRWRNAFAGLEGGEFGSIAYATGRSYESKNTPNILINNYFYQYGPVGNRVNSPDNQLNAIDINTGEVVWSRKLTGAGVGVGVVSLYGQIYRFDSANQQGIHAYLWSMVGSTWNMFDAMTGYWIMNFTNVHPWEKAIVNEPGTGNMLAYMINTRQGWMAMWNQTKCFDQGTTNYNGVIQYQSTQERTQYGVAGGMFRPSSTALHDWMKGIQWNVTIPIETQWMSPNLSASLSWGGISAPGGIAVAESWWNDPILVAKSVMQLYGYSLNNKNPGKLWGPVNMTIPIRTTRAIGADTYVMTDAARLTFLGFDLKTGRKLWDSDPRTSPWGSYTDGAPVIAYGKLYSDDFDGLHCIDIKTGKELWFATRGNAGVETPYGTWTSMGSATVGDGKVITRTAEFHNTAQIFKGERMFCWDATTGAKIWELGGYFETPVVAKGHIISYNLYDGYVYDVSKGPSATTVSVGPKVQASGSSVLIEGTVTDQSPGAPGTPAIADKFMSQWMAYLYQQQPKPMDAFGVPVELRAFRVDDGSIIEIGSVYSDINGHYEYKWTPPNTGTYKILANFPGSDSYWPSSAEASLGVDPAAAAPEPVEIPAYPDYTPLFAGIIVAVVIAIIIGLVNLFWKRK